MAILAFLILHAFKGLNGPYNSYVFVICLGFDELAAVQLLRWRAYVKR